MEQYHSIKKKYPGTVLFFRMGDFFEMFYDDAQIASDVLGLTLTSRAHGKSADVPLAGFPHHSIEPYLSKMVKAGYRVAVCEQVEDPKKAKGIVKREVLEVFTPGTATSDSVIEAGSNNYLVSLVADGDTIGMAGIDISTGEFFLTEGNKNLLLSQVENLNPQEIIYSVEQSDHIKSLITWTNQPLFTTVEDYYFSYEYSYTTLTEHFNTVSLKGFGCEELHAGVSAAGAALKYLQSIREGKLGHVLKLSVLSLEQYMVLDNATRRNLEIIAPMHENNREGSLLSVIDSTSTKMGARLLKSWILRPLLDKKSIQQRHQVVEELYVEINLREQLKITLKKMNDLERLTSKINTQRANARDVRGLVQSLRLIPEIRDYLKECSSNLLKMFTKELIPLDDIADRIEEALVDDPPVSISEGNIIQDGYDADLDELRKISRRGKQWILDLQEQERNVTGISSLRINYNKVFGYYIEVTNPNKSKVPEHYIRKQTLVNAERFITPEMKSREEQIVTAEEKIAQKEFVLFHMLRHAIAERTQILQENAGIIASLDVLCGFAHVAQENGFCKPKINDSNDLELIESRHPVVEKLLPADETFIPNDHSFTVSQDQIHIITGPNMAGKSTFLRQVGLCVLLAQIGSFVPARNAIIGIVDRIFTRVGAHDDVSRGESTFLVEMTELANILNNATPKSLLLLDEIGRGTSTFDGLSIAWSTVEYLHNEQSVAAKTLFATHYHEITALSHHLPRIANYYVQVKEWKDTVVFLRKIIHGSSDHSYGIHVAQMAGIPQAIVERARDVLDKLETMNINPLKGESDKDSIIQNQSDNFQINLFDMENTKIRKVLFEIDPESLTPREAIQILFDLKQILFEHSKSQSHSS